MYPGTFDPITNGHHELVRRAARIFDEVVVAVAASPHKAPMFALEERMQLPRDALADLDNVRVDGYTGLTGGYAKAHGLQGVIRGLRAVSGFEYEFQSSTDWYRSGRFDRALLRVLECHDEIMAVMLPSLRSVRAVMASHKSHTTP